MDSSGRGADGYQRRWVYRRYPQASSLCIVTPIKTLFILWPRRGLLGNCWRPRAMVRRR